MTQPNDLDSSNSPPAPAEKSIPSPKTTGGSGKKKRWLRRFIITFLLCLVLAVCFHRSLLQSAASFLVYASPLTTCDAVIVLGGGLTERVEKAIELYQDGFTKDILILLPETPESNAIYKNQINIESRICRGVLDLRGIPVEQTHWAPEGFNSTYEEIQYIKNWLRERKKRSALIVTGWYQSKRAKWTIDHFFSDSEFEIGVVPAPEESFPQENWWTHEQGIITIENETIKSIYYLLRMTFTPPGA